MTLEAEQLHELVDELNRKALGSLERILNDHELGAISRGEAKVALACLFDAVSGLVGPDVFDMISEASQELSAQAGTTTCTRMYVNPEGTIVLLEYVFGEPKVVVRTRVSCQPDAEWTKVAEQTFEGELIPFDAAKKRMDGYGEALVRQGYRLLHTGG